MYYDINRCSAPCVGFISKEDYQKDVDEALLFLTGKKTTLIFRLQKEMYRLSQALEYEKAAKIRDKLEVMKYFIEKQIPGSIEAKMREIFTLKNYPYHIECYDISNIGKTYRVGSRIVFKDGSPLKNEYRRYKIKSIQAASDLLMMEEVLRRSIREHKERNAYPDLMLIDGGVTQLCIAMEVLKEAVIPTIDLLSISKAREKRGKMIDYIHAPCEAKPYVLQDKEALHYLMRIRDEAHRFAKAYHKRLRDVRFDTSVLDRVSGIGPKIKRILLQHFKTLEDMRKARVEELMKIPGISKKIAKALTLS
jgi:excinuclease ABC subunit C